MKSSVLLFLLAIIGCQLYAQEGVWDSTFNSTGTLFIPNSNNYLPEEAAAVAVQPDGKIIVAGGKYVQMLSNPSITGTGVYRLLPNGSRDTSFGNVMNVSLYQGYSAIPRISGKTKRILVQKDGKIILGNELEGNQVFTLARLHANGKVDSGFGGVGAYAVPGVTRAMFYYSTEALTMEVLADLAFNKDSTAIFAIGWGYKMQYGNAYDYRGLVAKYKLNGQPDSSWGVNGHLLLESTGLLNKAMTGVRTYKLTVQPDGKLLIAGEIWNNAQDPWGGPEYFVARFNADGTKDTQFGVNGVAVAHILIANNTGGSQTAGVEPTGVFIGKNGSVICLGTFYGTLQGTKGYGYFISRWTAAGKADSSYGTYGTFRLGVSANHFSLQDAVRQVNGKIVATGTWIIDSLYTGQLTTGIKPFCMRIDTSSYPDLSFGSKGYFSYAAIAGAPALPAGLFHTASYLAIQSNGKIIVSGRNSSFFAGRIKADSAKAIITPNSITLATSTTANIKVYPNPVRTGTVYIQLPGNEPNADIYLHDLNGRLLSKEHFEQVNGKLSYQLPSHLAPGYYVLKVQTAVAGMGAIGLMVE